jgi:LmbE family N-acetylglucosaminyl deacetylase
MNKIDFLGKKLLFFTAHPDDESYTAAGVIYKNYKKGGRNMLLCASLGERGSSHLKKPVRVSQMKIIRKKELLKAGKFLHLKPLIFLNVPDGQLKRRSASIYRKGLRHAKRLQPEVIISFGPDGISGHLDHITLGRIARAIAKELHIPFISFALPPRVSKNALKYLVSRRTSGYYARRVTYRRPNIRISIDAEIKKRALRIHRSQMDKNSAFTGFPKFAVKELLKAEYFVSN